MKFKKKYKIISLLEQSCSSLEHGQAVCSAALQVVLRALQRNQSTVVLQHMFATVRAFIVRVRYITFTNL
jgi:hypothetical protein